MSKKYILLSVILILITLFLFFKNYQKKVSKANLPSLKEQIGQMLIFGFDEAYVNSSTPIVQDIMLKQIGGIILFDRNSKQKNYKRNIINPQQVLQLTQDLQNFSNKQFKENNSRSTLLIAVDYEGGLVDRLKTNYGFPLKTISAEEIATWSPRKIKQYAKSMAKILNKAGINYNLMPVVDLNINPDNPAIGRVYRSFSKDSKKVTSVAKIFINVFKKYQIASSLKHFPGHGSSNTHSDLEFVDITETWSPSELEPYKNLFNQIQNKNKLMTVMVTGIVNHKLDPSGLPANLSFNITTNLLRNKLGYDGVIITDDMQQVAITERYTIKESIIKAIQAGCDLLIFSNNNSHNSKEITPKQVIDIVVDAVEQNIISTNKIAASYRRIEKLKSSLSKNTGFFKF